MENDKVDRFYSRFFKVTLVLFLLSLVYRYVYTPTLVVGHSMDTTLSDGSYIVYSTLAKKVLGVNRGDIVAVYSKVDGSNKRIVKRVIGMPNEHIVVNNGNVYINDYLIHEPYLKISNFTDGFVDIKLGDNEYFVMGDNRANSLDSRDESIGAVTDKEIEGIVINYNLFNSK